MEIEISQAIAELREKLRVNTETRFKILGAIEILEQIEASKVTPTPNIIAPPTTEQGEVESPEDEE